MGLNDLDLWVGLLDAILQILAVAEASDEEDGLYEHVSDCRQTATETQRLADAYLDRISLGMILLVAFDADEVDLVLDQALNVGSQWLEDIFNGTAGVRSRRQQRPLHGRARVSYLVSSHALSLSPFASSSWRSARGKLIKVGGVDEPRKAGLTS